jgi:hypothetical protein
MAQLNRRTQTQLTAPGVTADLKLSPYAGPRWFKVVVATIDTNIVVRSESTDGTTVTAQTPNTTITANGTYLIPVYADNSHVQFNFVSEAGGTAATVDVTLIEETN